MVQYNKYVALLVIDFQNDFSDPQGSHYIPGASEIVSYINAEINLCRAGGGEVIYTQDWHPERAKHFESHNGRVGEHCVRNSWGAQIHPDLEISGDVLRKGILVDKEMTPVCGYKQHIAALEAFNSFHRMTEKLGCIITHSR